MAYFTFDRTTPAQDSEFIGVVVGVDNRRVTVEVPTACLAHVSVGQLLRTIFLRGSCRLPSEPGDDSVCHLSLIACFPQDENGTAYTQTKTAHSIPGD